MDLKDYIRSIPDYPKKGILFRDITTLIKNEKAFSNTIEQIVNASKEFKVDSAGTAGYHIGKQPDVRSIDIAKKHDIDLTSQRARQFNRRDFENFDKI